MNKLLKKPLKSRKNHLNENDYYFYLTKKGFLITLKKPMEKRTEQLPRGHYQDVLIEPRQSLSEQALKDILKKCGLKITTQRLTILRVLNTGPGYHKTANDIFEEVKKNHSNIGFATVYRLLKKLTQSGLVTEISMGAGSSCYELKSNHFHYHIACVKCGKIVEFKNKSIEHAFKKLVSENDFILKNQVVELYVVCESRRCKKLNEEEKQ